MPLRPWWCHPMSHLVWLNSPKAKDSLFVSYQTGEAVTREFWECFFSCKNDLKNHLTKCCVDQLINSSTNCCSSTTLKFLGKLMQSLCFFQLSPLWYEYIPSLSGSTEEEYYSGKIHKAGYAKTLFFWQIKRTMFLLFTIVSVLAKSNMEKPFQAKYRKTETQPTHAHGWTRWWMFCRKGDVDRTGGMNAGWPTLDQCLKAGKGLLRCQVQSEVKIFTPLHWTMGK